MKYIVMEIQSWATGATSTPTWAYDDRNKAEAKYHSVLAAAALSELPVHAAVLLRSDGATLASNFYEHAQPEPEPEEVQDEPEDA